MIRMGQPAAASNPSTATPAMIAQSITGRPYLSWSQTQQYQMCPRAFEFKYVLKAAPAFAPSSLVFGSAMHEAFAKVHEAQMEGAPAPTAGELTQGVAAVLQGEALPIRYSKLESAETLNALASRMIDAIDRTSLFQCRGQVSGALTSASAQEIPPHFGE